MERVDDGGGLVDLGGGWRLVDGVCVGVLRVVVGVWMSSIGC
jgi:hypothetical protein